MEKHYNNAEEFCVAREFVNFYRLLFKLLTLTETILVLLRAIASYTANSYQICSLANV